MNDLIEKVEYLALRMRVARDLALGLVGTDYDKRLMGRAVFQLVYAFLDVAPKLQNELRRSGTITTKERDDIRAKIKVLRGIFERKYQPIRHSLTAHHQKLDLKEIILHWHTVSEDAIGDAHAMLIEVAERLLRHRGGIEWNKAAADVAAFAKQCVGGSDSGTAVKFSTDSLALTRPNTSGLITGHPHQEKAARINTILQILKRSAEYMIAAANSNSALLIADTVASLHILAGTSLLDNLYGDQPGDDCLLTLWKTDGYGGIPILDAANAARATAFEARIRRIRNHFAAHLDASMTLKDALEEFRALNHGAASNYFFEHAMTFRRACAADVRTKIFLILDQPVRGVVGLSATLAEPFSKQ